LPPARLASPDPSASFVTTRANDWHFDRPCRPLRSPFCPFRRIVATAIMAAEQRKLLEQLMGASTSRQAQVSMDDPKVCRSYIVGTCPHDLFTNTKQDFGPCSKIHSEGLKAEYEAMPERDRQRL